jgi:hypothetical protein
MTSSAFTTSRSTNASSALRSCASERSARVESGHDLLGLHHVALHERVERLAELRLGEVGQGREVVQGPERRRLGEIPRALGDVHGQIAHALQVGHDLQGGGDEAEVARRRLAQREQAPAGAVDLHLQPVHLGVVRLDPGRQLDVALGDGADARGDGRLHLPPHGEELVAELLQLRLVGLVGVDRGHAVSAYFIRTSR